MKKFVNIAILFIQVTTLWAVPVIKGSISPDGKYHVVMDIDRDPTIEPEYKGDSYPMIEVTEIKTGKIVSASPYFGSMADDGRTLRDHITILWRKDSAALAINISDRFYSFSAVLVKDERGRYISVAFPTYTQMTGFASPDPKELRPRGWARVIGWDKNDYMIYDISFSPLPSYRGRDPLKHKVLLKVSAEEMITVKQPNQ